MEEYTVPKMFPELREKVDAKIDQPKKQGGWAKLKKGPRDSKEAPAVSVAPQDMHGESSSLPNGTEMQRTQSGFRPGDQFFFEKASFAGGESPDVDVKSITKDGEVLSFEKGAKFISVDSPEKFSRKIGTADGLKYDEIGRSQDDRAFGRGLLDKLNRADVSSIERQGYDDDQNQMLRIIFLMQRRHLQEMVVGYERKLVGRADVSQDMKEIKTFSKTILADFSIAGEVGDFNGSKHDKRSRKPHQKKKMRLDEQGPREKGVKRNMKKNATRTPSDPVSMGDSIQTSTMEHDAVSMEKETGNPAEQMESYQNFLEETARVQSMFIDSAHDIESLEGAFSYEVDPMTGKQLKKKIFLRMSDDAQQIFDAMGRSSQRDARSLWVERNSDLEALYLGKKFTFALDAVKADWRKRFEEAKDFDELDTIGSGQNGSRSFIPTDPKNDSVAFRSLREVLQEMIVHRRGLPQDTTLPGFSKLFGDQLKPLIVSANKELTDSWTRRRREFGTEMVDSAALQRDTQEAITHFLTKSLALIDDRLAAKGENFLDIYRNDRERAKKLLAAIGERIVVIAADAAGRVEQKDADRLKQAVVQFGTAQLAKTLKQRVSGLLELKEA